MQEKAEHQLKDFDIIEARNLIKSLNSGEFDKMIFKENQTLKRANFLYVKYKAESASRIYNRLDFPMHITLRSSMAVLEGGVSAHGEKAIMTSNELIRLLESSYSIKPIADHDPAGMYFDFPLDVENSDLVSDKQRLYFIPGETEVSTCLDCTGEKYITCQDSACNGNHEWPCIDCDAKGVLTCNNCAGAKRVDCSSCNGSNKISCRSCGGDGKKVDKLDTLSAINSSSRSTRVVQKTCKSCSGRGQINCSGCNNGKVTCSTCSGNGKVTCSDCNGLKKITCSECYGDKEKRGKIDCPVCKANGEIGTLSFVETLITRYNKEKFINIGDDLPDLDIEKALLHANKNGKVIRMYTNINDNINSNHHDLVRLQAESLRSELGLKSDSFEKVLTEDVYYEVVPCVQLTYTHMLTNTEHTLSIVNVHDKPELVFHSQAEEVKKDFKNAGKAVGGLFGKLFKTKKFKGKEDKKNEIKLMIYLAKADGIIEDQEKAFLADKISNLDDFIASEKKDLFDLMNMRDLPELTASDVVFSTTEKGEEVLVDLIKLASSDGDLEPREQKLIDDIKVLMN